MGGGSVRFIFSDGQKIDHTVYTVLPGNASKTVENVENTVIAMKSVSLVSVGDENQ